MVYMGLPGFCVARGFGQDPPAPAPAGATRLIACNASHEFARCGQAQHFGLCLRTHIESKAENSTTHLVRLAHTGRWHSVGHAPRLQPDSEDECNRVNN